MQTTYFVGGGWGERKYYRKMKVRLIYSLVPALDLCEYFSSNIIRIQFFFLVMTDWSVCLISANQ